MSTVFENKEASLRLRKKLGLSHRQSSLKEFEEILGVGLGTGS